MVDWQGLGVCEEVSQHAKMSSRGSLRGGCSNWGAVAMSMGSSLKAEVRLCESREGQAGSMEGGAAGKVLEEKEGDRMWVRKSVALDSTLEIV